MSSFLVVLAALAAVATSTPLTINVPDSPTAGKEMFASMMHMAENILNQDNEVTEFKEPEGNFEMRINGFSGVIKTRGKTNQEEELPAKKDEPVAAAVIRHPAEEESTKDSVEEEHPRYKKLGSGYYKFHDHGNTWFRAIGICEREGAHLVILNSDKEAQLIGKLFARNPRPHAFYPDQIWVGMNDIQEEGHFVSIQGEDLASVGYNKWMKNQPDDWKVENPSGEDCVTMTRDMELNDVHCTANMPFVCELNQNDSKPIPSFELLELYHAEAEENRQAEENRKAEENREDSSDDSSEEQPDDYVQMGNSLYKFYKYKTWLEAKGTCEREGAHLVVVDSDEEAQLMEDLFSQHSVDLYDNRHQIWVGASDIQEEGHFVTVLGEDLSSSGYSRWQEGQPDDWTDDNPDGEDCVMMLIGENLLNDYDCTARRPFVCERETTVSVIKTRQPRRNFIIPPWRSLDTPFLPF